MTNKAPFFNLIYFFLILLFACNNKVKNDLYVANTSFERYGLKTPLASLKDSISDSNFCFVKVITIDSNVVIKVNHKTKFKIFSDDKLLLERNEQDFYFENYSKNSIALMQYKGEYYYKLTLEESGQVFICYDTKGKKEEEKLMTLSSPDDYEIITPNDWSVPFIQINTSQSIVNFEKRKVTINVNNKDYTTYIKIRGKTSQSFPKKQFSVEFENETPLFQNKKEGVLNAPYADRSLIRNAFVYSLSKAIGLEAPISKFCHLSVNNIYQGIYLFMDKPVPNDSISLVKMDDKLTFNTKNKGVVGEGMKNIHYEVLRYNDSTFDKEKHAIELLEKYCQTDSINYIIDLSSFAKYFIINELSKNVDAYRKSIYLSYHENEQKLYAGPVWDYNFSLGLPNFNEANSTEGFVYDYEPMKPWMAFWWNELIKNPTFKNVLIKEYKSLRKSELSDDKILRLIDAFVASLNGEEELNFAKWNVLEAKDFWPNYHTPSSYTSEIDYIKTWLLNRLYWLDNQWK